MDNDQTIEQLIVAKGKTAARVTPADVEATIASQQFHVFPGSQLTVCVLTLRNGFTVTGESACASPENFDAEIGERVARENARQKIWPLLGYVLKELLARPVLTDADAAADLAGTPRPDNPGTPEVAAVFATPSSTLTGAAEA